MTYFFNMQAAVSVRCESGSELLRRSLTYLAVNRLVGQFRPFMGQGSLCGLV